MGFPIPHSDEPTVEDQLARGHLSKEIATVAATANPPLALGVHGDWGSGKTSFMQQVRKALDEGPHKNRVVTVGFDAWRYQHESVPVVALLHEMRRQFPFLKKSRGEAEKIAEITFRSLLGNLDAIAKLIGQEAAVPISPEKIRSIGEAWEKERLETPLASNDLRNFLQSAIDALLPPNKKDQPSARVIVFIDDLDRCNPDMAYRLLEGLKIYLNLKNCVFVLAMNQQIVIEALASVMKKDDDDTRLKLKAEAYLEKLCANIWRLPPPSEPAAYFTGLLHEAVPKQAIKNAGSMEYSFLPPNPRRLKALANLYNRLWWRVAQTSVPLTDLSALRVLLLAYVYQFHSELYQRWRHDPRFFLRLLDWLSGRIPTDTKTTDNACFLGLTLPTQLTLDLNEPKPSLVSNYPDPAAPGIFWIAPLLQLGGLLESDGPQDYKDLLGLESIENKP